MHVADAFDAMTSGRAYRPAHGRAEAMRELWRCAGPQFDAEVVRALSLAVPTIDVAPDRRRARARRNGIASFHRRRQAGERARPQKGSHLTPSLMNQNAPPLVIRSHS